MGCSLLSFAALRRLEGFKEPWEHVVFKGKLLQPTSKLVECGITADMPVITVRKSLFPEGEQCLRCTLFCRASSTCAGSVQHGRSYRTTRRTSLPQTTASEMQDATSRLGDAGLSGDDGKQCIVSKQLQDQRRLCRHLPVTLCCEH